MPSCTKKANCLHPGPPSAAHRRRRKPPKSTVILRKCRSEPLLLPSASGRTRLSSKNSGKASCFIRVNSLNHNNSNNFMASQTKLIPSPLGRSKVEYEKNAKVLITVTVEGSPGPIRTLVEPITSVEDTIKLVIHKYREQGRIPWLPMDIDVASSYDLHVSYFSLQCLDRLNTIGESGSRSFYLRKNNTRNHEKVTATMQATSEITSILESSTSLNRRNPPIMVLPFPPSMIQKINKFMQGMHKLFKVLGCLDSI